MADPVVALPPRFIDLKREIAASYPDFQERVTKAWVEVLEELERLAQTLAKEGSSYIPQVKFSDLANLSQDEIEIIKRKGSVVIKDVVDDDEAASWKVLLEEFIKANPDVDGTPTNDKQFFQLYWTKSQVLARSHPNMLAASTWLNNLYHTRSDEKLEGVDLSTPLSYADRFRIRHPGGQWDAHPPHVDGGAIERWEDKNFRTCFANILSGNWRQHDPYDLECRLNTRTSMYGRPSQSSVFRAFQGWLAISEIAPTQGTLKVFPDVLLANAYIILRPFFRPTVPADSEDALDSKNWEFDISSSEFPGIYPLDGGYKGPRPTPALHPHLRLDVSMISVPKVNPGDTVFWHCDVIHAVEREHTGTGDAAVLYIPAVPLTPQNAAYVQKQKDDFIAGKRPSDFPQGRGEIDFVGVGRPDDISDPLGRQAMGLPIRVA